MSHQTPSKPTSTEALGEGTLRIALYSDEALGQISVDAESFIGLNIWMGEELAALEDRFIDFQTPRTSCRRRNTRG